MKPVKPITRKIKRRKRKLPEKKKYRIPVAGKKEFVLEIAEEKARKRIAQRLWLGRAFDAYERRFKGKPQKIREEFEEFLKKKGVYKQYIKLLTERRRKRTWIVDRKLEDYNRALKEDLIELAKEKCKAKQEKMKAEGRKGKAKIRVLDIGPGKGFFLKSVKRKFKNKVETVGQYLAHPGERKVKGIDRKVVGSIDFKSPQGRFDVIVSIMGSRYALSQATVLQRLCNALSVNGTAILHIPATFKYQPFLDKLNASRAFKAEFFKSKARKHYKRPLEINCIRIEKTGKGMIDFSEEMAAEWVKLMKRQFKMPLVPTRKGFPKVKD